MITLPCPLKVHIVNFPLVNDIENWLKIVSDTVKQVETCQDKSTLCQVGNANAWVSCSFFVLSAWGKLGLNKDINIIRLET